MDEQNIYENRANVKKDISGIPETQDTSCYNCCSEVLVFAMQDNYHQFSLGLGTVLECLHAAEQAGSVPPLPDGWWIQVKCMYE